MNNKDWIRNTLLHRSGQAVPFNFLFSPLAAELIKKHYNIDSIETMLNSPIRMNGSVSIKPLYADPDIYGHTIKDEFGITWSTNKIDRGSPIQPCLHDADLSGYKFPEANQAYRFENHGKWCEDNRENFTVIWVGDLWERATFMRGMEDLLLDLYLNPDFIMELMRRLTDYILQTMTILFERFEFDAIALSDDYGAQNAMLMSPADWRKFIKPFVSEIYTFAKEHKRTVFHHSCGHIYPIIGDLIEIGLDILHPIQPEAMDIFKLKKEFGNDLTFCGGINTQKLLPFGTPDEIRNEIRRLKSTMGAGGGYILEPGITIQADVPLRNLIAMIEEVLR